MVSVSPKVPKLLLGIVHRRLTLSQPSVGTTRQIGLFTKRTTRHQRPGDGFREKETQTGFSCSPYELLPIHRSNLISDDQTNKEQADGSSNATEIGSRRSFSSNDRRFLGCSLPIGTTGTSNHDERFEYFCRQNFSMNFICCREPSRPERTVSPINCSLPLPPGRGPLNDLFGVFACINQLLFQTRSGTGLIAGNQDPVCTERSAHPWRSAKRKTFSWPFSDSFLHQCSLFWIGRA